MEALATAMLVGVPMAAMMAVTRVAPTVAPASVGARQVASVVARQVAVL